MKRAKMAIRKGFFLGVACLLACTLSSCKKKPTVAELAKKEQRLLIGIGNYLSSLDPQLEMGFAGMYVIRSLFEGLVVANAQTLAPEPGVAQSWEISEDGLKYTFYLRKEAKWSNEDPVVAADFAFAFQRLLAPEFASPWASMAFVIKNAEAYNKKEIDFSEVGVKATAPRVLELTLEKPVPFFLSLLYHTAFSPLHRKSIEVTGNAYDRDNAWTLPEICVGNGAFTLQLAKADKITVVCSESYWDKEHFPLKAVEFFMFPTAAVEEIAFRDGKLHVTECVPFPQIKQYMEKKSPEFRTAPYLGTTFFTFNVRKAPFDDARVRKAFSLALNRSLIVKDARAGGDYRPIYKLIPEAMPGYQSITTLEEDVALARKLLAEAGYPEGRGFPKVTLYCGSVNDTDVVGESAQAMWKENLNVEIGLQNIERKTMLAQRRAGNFDIIKGTWIADYADPTAFLDIFRSNDPSNYAGWKSLAFDHYLSSAKELKDPEKRRNLLQQAEKVLLDEMPIIPLYGSASVHLVHPCVKNWFYNPMGIQIFKEVTLE